MSNVERNPQPTSAAAIIRGLVLIRERQAELEEQMHKLAGQKAGLIPRNVASAVCHDLGRLITTRPGLVAPSFRMSEDGNFVAHYMPEDIPASFDDLPLARAGIHYETAEVVVAGDVQTVLIVDPAQEGFFDKIVTAAVKHSLEKQEKYPSRPQYTENELRESVKQSLWGDALLKGSSPAQGGGHVGR